MTPQATRFHQVVSGPDEAINLAEAALLIASGAKRQSRRRAAGVVKS